MACYLIGQTNKKIRKQKVLSGGRRGASLGALRVELVVLGGVGGDLEADAAQWGRRRRGGEARGAGAVWGRRRRFVRDGCWWRGGGAVERRLIVDGGGAVWGRRRIVGGGAEEIGEAALMTAVTICEGRLLVEGRRGGEARGGGVVRGRWRIVGGSDDGAARGERGSGEPAMIAPCGFRGWERCAVGGAEQSLLLHPLSLPRGGWVRASGQRAPRAQGP
uniref:Uncharacterized protein n=1 Tax=Oryza sativa subsp. japonica TaxID=39947 RepID=Q84MV0_ORYSJ|nr:hypothetical protein OSJNBa0087G11.2 [Oryza sativa Japonica Group]